MNEALNLANESADDVCLGCAYRGLGEIYVAKNQGNLAKQSFLHAIEAFERANDLIAILEIKEFLK